MPAPILLLVYNRTDTLARVWAVLEEVRPPVLFISADGPKPERPEDTERTTAVRQLVQQRLTWRCDAYFNFAPTNQGCRLGVANGITWFFSHVEAGIILEDDTLPHPTFFSYATQLLEHYKGDERIGTLTGYQPFVGWKGFAGDWDFIRMPLIWGWATWRRVWQRYDPAIADWPQVKKAGLLQRLPGLSPPAQKRLHWLFQEAWSGKVDTWDYQLTYLLLREGQLTVIPRLNLIQNLGHGHPLAVHTRNRSLWAHPPLHAWQGARTSPPFLLPNLAYEQALWRHIWTPSLVRRAWYRLKTLSLKHGQS